MVKLVIGDELQLNSLEERLTQSGVPVQIGIVVGKLSPNSDRGYVYSLIPTPPTDGGGPACSLKSEAGKDDKKKGAKGGGRASADPKASLLIDGDWVAEHARQVSRMLLGGMNVVGVYVCAPEAPFKATPPSILAQTVMGVAQAAPWYDSEFDERLLIHISYSPRRWACRSCTLSSGSLRPSDFKLGKLLSSLQAFRCTYNFEIRLPIFYAGGSDSSIFKNIICNGISRHSKELQSARALINGKLVAEDQPSTSEGLNNVELLLPFMSDASTEACSSEDIAGIIVFSGAICASAYLGPKEPISQAISDLKGDIITSLKSRLEIITDEAEREADTQANTGREARNENEISAEKSIHRIILHKSRKPFLMLFPRRVLVPWVAGIFICDYLQPFETFEDVKEHCKEMISMEAPIESCAMLEPETEPTTAVTVKTFWDVINGVTHIEAARDGKHENPGKNRGQLRGNKFSFLAAVIVLLVAVFGGLVITLFQLFRAASHPQ